MSRTLAGVLAGCLVLTMVAVAGAGIPDADESFVTMTAGGRGLTTCPLGDAGAYSYITVTARRTDQSPIQGIPSSNFFFTVSGSGSGNVTISAFDTETDVNGEIRFEADSSGAIAYGMLTIDVQIYTVVLSDTDTLWCNTYDLDGSGQVTPIDLSNFAGKYGTVDESANYDWSADGIVTPVDLSKFAGHYGH
jgi:hypothetical protein